MKVFYFKICMISFDNRPGVGWFYYISRFLASFKELRIVIILNSVEAFTCINSLNMMHLLRFQRITRKLFYGVSRVKIIG